MGLYKRSLKVKSEKLNKLINESNQLKEKVKALEQKLKVEYSDLVRAFNYECLSELNLEIEKLQKFVNTWIF